MSSSFNIEVSPFDNQGIHSRSYLMLANELQLLMSTFKSLKETPQLPPLDETKFYEPHEIGNIWHTHKTHLSQPTQLMSLKWYQQCLKDIMIAKASKGSITIPVHHPYYRHCLKHTAINFGYSKIKSVYLGSIPHHDDSLLYYHNNCQKHTPASKLNWRPDYNHWGGIHQMQATCDHCRDYDKLLSDYENDNDSVFGYKQVSGKNALFISFSNKNKHCHIKRIYND